MQKTTNFMYIWGELILLSLKPFGRFPVTLQRLWIMASFCFYFFFLPLLQDVRNKYFNSKWHCGALQCCRPGLCPQQPPHFSQQRGMQPEHGPSASTATPRRCQNIAEQGHQQLAGRLFYTFKTHKNIYSSVGSGSCWGTYMLFAMCLLWNKT